MKLWLASGLLMFPTALFPAPQPEQKSAPGVDAFGDALPDGAVARLGSTRLRHVNGVLALAFSQDGQMLASAGNDSWLKIWDADTGRQLMALNTQNIRFNFLSFSPDSKVLVATNAINALRVWEVPSGKLLWQDQAQGGAPSVAWSANGKQLALARSDGVLKVVDGLTGKIAFECERQERRLTAAAFTSDGKELMAIADDFTVRRFAIGTGKRLDSQNFPQGIVRSVPPAPPGMALTPDGQYLALAQNASGAWLWKVGSADAQRLAAKEITAGAMSVAVAAQGKFVALSQADGCISLWGRESGRPLRVLSAFRFGSVIVALAPDGRRLAAASLNDRLIRLWDVAANRALVSESRGGDILHSTFLRDGKSLVTSANTGELTAWDLTTGKVTDTFAPPNLSYYALGDAPDGKGVRALDVQQRTVLWEPGKPGEIKPRVKPALSLTFPYAFSPGGILHGSRVANSIVIRNAESSDEVRKIDLVGAPGLNLLQFSPDARWLLGIENGRTCRVWEVDSGRPLAPVNLLQFGPAVFSPDGRLLVHADATLLHIWELASDRERLKASRAPVGIRSIAVSADGRLVFLGGTAGELIVHDAWDGKELRKIAAHSGGIRALTLSPDNRYLLTTGDDGTGLVWEMAKFIPSAVPRAEPSADEIKGWINDLSEFDPARAATAIRGLSAAPVAALSALKEKLEAPGEPAIKQISKLIEQLDDNRFKVRDAAMKELEKRGVEARSALEEALKKSPSEDARQRIEKLLKNIQGGTVGVEQMREMRIVEVLERMGTPEARRFLAGLAERKDSSALSHEARWVLKRLPKD
jgi:WD40 repeat protein